MSNKGNICGGASIIVILLCICAILMRTQHNIKENNDKYEAFKTLYKYAPNKFIKTIDIAVFDEDGNQVTEYVNTKDDNTIVKFQLDKHYFAVSDKQYFIGYGVPRNCQNIGVTIDFDEDNNAIVYNFADKYKAVLSVSVEEYNKICLRADSICKVYQDKVAEYKEKYGEETYEKLSNSPLQNLVKHNNYDDKY